MEEFLFLNCIYRLLTNKHITAEAFVLPCLKLKPYKLEGSDTS